jgi:hypothetical protein
VNHMFPSGPAAIPHGLRIERSPVENSVMSPAVVIRPIFPASDSVNQSTPSGPFAIPVGPAPSLSPSVNSVMLPSGVTRPIRLVALSTYQRLLSGPTAMSSGSPALRVSNSVTSPDLVTRAIAPLPPAMATHRLPSRPVTIPLGLPVGKPAVNSVITAPGVMRPTALFVYSVNQRLPSGPGAMPQSPTPAVRPVSNSEVTGPPVVASAAPGKARPAKTAIAIVIRPRTEPVSAPPSAA